MAKGLVTLIGGSGFIGRYAARTLVEAGWRVRVACRRPNVAQDVRVAGPPGWVDLVQANVRNTDSLKRAMEGADAVVNLVGILFESGKQTFSSAQLDGARTAAEVARESGAERFVQISAIGADAQSSVDYARTKGAAEAAVAEAFPGAVILRPSIVFGPEDQFFNRFAQMARFAPALPAIGGGKTKFQPVYAGDVADAIVCAVTRDDVAGNTYELGGPGTYTFNALYDFIFETIDRRRLKAPLPFFLAKAGGVVAGAVFRYVPPFSWGLFGAPPLTGGQVDLLRKDNVVASDALTLADLGVTELESIEAIVPTYLWRFRPYGEFHRGEV
ncbi:MAG: complex I NDUFA9 subunit family protein [Pseudomonadota bacterium]